MENSFNVDSLVSLMGNLQLIVHADVKSQREYMRSCKHKGEPVRFSKDCFVITAQEDFSEGQKLCLRWRSPRWVIEGLRDYVYLVEDYE